ncbi:hypothetical protein ABEB36_010574 [Hypothenemus hampei]|uniref:Uncharacterized protein n=1 Tax=Hypothenemus hampei TaxID=57062 RepID=A0ABD1EK87_HYPHA
MQKLKPHAVPSLCLKPVRTQWLLRLRSQLTETEEGGGGGDIGTSFPMPSTSQFHPEKPLQTYLQLKTTESVESIGSTNSTSTSTSTISEAKKRKFMSSSDSEGLKGSLKSVESYYD